ncbi:ElyC/SanA/YdcF family protein [Halomonas garicola]|uniref:ElyC/SanA/YdcF family protein n=1 Tax=Halomonas garicola TaxID=1690008 RepID=UPI002897C8F7|nr:ElyC/SanA/YdcF family protein [Halomonas garicola]
MYELVKTLAAQLLMPLPLCMGLLALGAVLLKCRYRRAGWSAFALGAAVLALASWGPVAERLLMPLETRYPALQDLPEAPPAEAVVVLGGGWRPGAPWSSVGRLNNSSAIRLMEGIRLWQQASDLPLIVTGASRDPGEAPIARGYGDAAKALGVPETRLRLLDHATDTGQEAQAVREALGEGATVVLVTSASHMPRAMRHFQKAGLTPVAAPTHYLLDVGKQHSLGYWLPSARHLHKTERAMYEALGHLALRLE